MREILPTMLDIVVTHNVYDTDKSVEYDEIKRVEARDIRTGDSISTGAIIFGEMVVFAISPEMITLGYKGQSKTLRSGEEWEADFTVVDNAPYRSRDEIGMTVTYHTLTPWERIVEIMDHILHVHKNNDSSVIAETTEDEQRVLTLVDMEIESGDVGCHVLKALLSSCNNWFSASITRLGQFQEILLEGIDKGALAPDDETGWRWMKAAAETNDPATFITDMDRYYDLLSCAVENGNYDALDVMNAIWEPEQIIEED